MTNEAALALLARVTPVLKEAAKKTSLLGTIAWSNEVQARFFEQKADVLPDVTYAVDRVAVSDRLQALQALEQSISGQSEVEVWLRETARSYIDGSRLMLAVGSKDFYHVSLELYGGAKSSSWDNSSDHLALAEHILERLNQIGFDEAQDPAAQVLSDEEFAQALRKRVAERTPPIELSVQVDDDLTAKIQAGRTRVRIRKGATFHVNDLDNLWSHEVETHALSAQNGAAQPYAPFLSAGGPRSTRTQEGLATFAELYDHDLTVGRMRDLAMRVKLVAMAEDGANFIDLYRHGLQRGQTPKDAYLDAARVCRGGLVTGGAPFTKDVCYLAGLLDVYTFLTYMVRAGNRDEAELLVCGRISLDDMPALIALRQRGIIERPRYLPQWLLNWSGLLPYFAFTSFLGAIDLAPVERKFKRVLEMAAQAR